MKIKGKEQIIVNVGGLSIVEKRRVGGIKRMSM